MCERTQEFLQFVRQAQATNTSSQLSVQKKKSSSSSSQGESRTSFNEAATDIARGIGRTSSLLAKLTSLVKRQGLFDDPTEEINNLIHRIKQDLDELNTKCDTAQQFVDSKKSYFSSSASNQSSQHNGKVVSGLKSELMTTTKDFKAVLELRSHKMKDQQQKKVDLVGKSLLSPVRDLERLQRAKQEQDQQGGGNGPLNRRLKGPLPSPYALDPENSIAWSRSQEQQAQQQLLLEPIATTQYYEAREQAVSEVERTIGELGQLFHRLSTMLAQQQELVERIDEDVENAVSNTQNARDALMKAYESVSSNRAMYFKIGAIIAAFVLFFVLFVL